VAQPVASVPAAHRSPFWLTLLFIPRCATGVNFVIDNDPDCIFCFASMQSRAGREILDAIGRSDDLSSFVLVDDEGFWTQSTAALRVAAGLSPAVLRTAGVALQPIPYFLRDGLYRVVADNRYSILGRVADGDTPSCQLKYDYATLRERMLDLDG